MKSTSNLVFVVVLFYSYQHVLSVVLPSQQQEHPPNAFSAFGNGISRLGGAGQKGEVSFGPCIEFCPCCCYNFLQLTSFFVCSLLQPAAGAPTQRAQPIWKWTRPLRGLPFKPTSPSLQAAFALALHRPSITNYHGPLVVVGGQGKVSYACVKISDFLQLTPFLFVLPCSQ